MTKLLIHQAIEQLSSASKTVELLRTEMNRLAEQLVMAMGGAGKSLGPQLMAEIGDVTRFAHKGSLAAYAGVDPGANQSGIHEAKSTASFKNGSPKLRKALFLVMSDLLQTMPAERPGISISGQETRRGQALLCLHDRWRQQVPPRLLRQGEGVFGASGTDRVATSSCI